MVYSNIIYYVIINIIIHKHMAKIPKHIIIFIISLLLVLSLLAYGIWFYKNTGNYSGKIIGPHYLYPIETIAINGAKIELISKDNSNKFSFISDLRGNFIFKNIPIKNYTLTISPYKGNSIYYEPFITDLDMKFFKKINVPITFTLALKPEVRRDIGRLNDFVLTFIPGLRDYKDRYGHYPNVTEEIITNEGPLIKALKPFINPTYTVDPEAGYKYFYSAINNGRGYILKAQSESGIDRGGFLKEENGQKFYIFEVK